MSSSALEQSRIALALQHSPIPALRKLGVEESDAAVVLTGKVSSYYFKQLAQETILPLLGSRELCNQVAVERQVPVAVN